MLQGFLRETFLQQEPGHDKLSTQHEDVQIYGLMFIYILDIIYYIYDYIWRQHSSMESLKLKYVPTELPRIWIQYDPIL